MLPDNRGYFGEYGGKFVPETLIPALDMIDRAYREALQDPEFARQLDFYARHYIGRVTPLYSAARLSAQTGGAQIYLKREDLNHTGSHKINNTMGQALLARRMGKTRLIAETGAGQHGVATATVAAALGFECTVYMGAADMERQRLNVFRMQALGAEVRKVDKGSRTLKDASNEALRDFIASYEYSHLLIGSVIGPHPYPRMVRDFQSVIGRELKQQCLEQLGRLPDGIVACVGGGSNAMGVFYPFLEDGAVKLYGVEAGGQGSEPGMHCATLGRGGNGVLHGAMTYLLQDEHGQIADTHSIAAGLDYPGVGPEHAYLQSVGRVEYGQATDREAVEAFRRLCLCEGIIPALESAHAVAYALLLASRLSADQVIVVNLSGRGDKDAEVVAELERRGLDEPH